MNTSVISVISAPCYTKASRTRGRENLNITQSRMTDNKGEGHCRPHEILGTGRVALQDPSAAFSTASKKYADFVRTLHFVGMLDAGWIYEW